MATTFQYLIQVFVSFAEKPEFRPLLLRIDETATVKSVVAAALQRMAAGGLALPSEVDAHFALCHAQGDGSIDASTAAPLDPNVVLRDAGIQFPFMLALVYVGDSGYSPSRATPPSQTAALTLGAALTAAEREQAIARNAELQRVREENVREIERQRAAKEIEHFHRSETYELERREANAKAKAQRRQAELAEEALRVEREALEQQTAKRAAEAQREEIELHRRRMQAAIDAENARLEDARRRQAAHEQAHLEAKRAAAAQRQAELAASRDDRMSATLDSLVANLDDTLVRRRAAEESLAEEQRQRRAEAATQALQLKDVQLLEASREHVRVEERAHRQTKHQLSSERQRIAALSAIENSASRSESDDRAFAEWKLRQLELTQDLESALELELRQKRNAVTRRS